MRAVALAEAALDAADDKPYTEVERPVTASTAQYLDQVSSRPPASGGTSLLTIGGATYRRDGNSWVRIRKIRNNAYWDKPTYFVIFGTMAGKWTMIFCKIPRTATQVAFRRAIKTIARDYTHDVVQWENVQVDGADEKMYLKRISGNAPEPAYSIDASGQFTREH